MDRHARQSKLTEIGAGGQAKIAAATVAVSLDGVAADIAARYLAGAGVAVLRVRDPAFAEGARALEPALGVAVVAFEVEAAGVSVVTDDARRVDDVLRDPAARDLARGALAALRALGGVLGATS